MAEHRYEGRELTDGARPRIKLSVAVLVQWLPGYVIVRMSTVDTVLYRPPRHRALSLSLTYTVHY